MMKLMADTIGYLRDLLVFKVKPDALSDEASAEMRTAFNEKPALNKSSAPSGDHIGW